MGHPIKPRREQHYVDRVGWLRAAVLGANDGILSTASLMIGVAGARTSTGTILLTGAAGLLAGALSMAAGEFVSVSSQADTENADLRKERRELKDDPKGETRELAAIYVKRGLDTALATQVAEALMAKDALAAHAQDELGLSETSRPRPFLAAAASAASFGAGALLPVLAALVAPVASVAPAVGGASLVGLVVLGLIGAQAGGAPRIKAALRVLFWGALAMTVTFAAGRIFGAQV